MTNQTSPARPRFWRRALIYGAVAIPCLAVIVALAGFGLMRSDAGQRWIAETVGSAVSTPGGLQLSIIGLEGRLPQEIRIAEVHVSDVQGEWLRARALRLDWSPLDLLGGTLTIAGIEAEEIVVERVPESGADDEMRDEPGLPALPFEIVVGELAVRDLTLGEAILGQRGHFRIAGQAAAQAAEGLVTKLDIARSDGAPGRIALEALFHPQDERLRLNAQVEEPAGGTIARLSGMPDLPAVQAQLTGDGPLSDWRGTLTLTLENMLALESQISLAQREGLAFGIDGTAEILNPGTNLPDGIPPALAAGTATFSARGQIDEARKLTLDSASIENPAARLTLNGGIALETLNLDATAQVELRDPTLAQSWVPDLRAEDLVLTLQAKGPALRPKLDATLRANATSLPEAQARAIEAQAQFVPDRDLDQGAPEGAIDARGTMSDLVVTGLQDLTPLLGPSVTWSLSGRLSEEAQRFDAETLRVETAVARLSGSGSADLATGSLETAAELALADLAPLAPLIGLDVKGAADMQAWIASDDLGASGSAVLTGGLSGIATPEPVLQALVGGESTLAANIALTPDGVLRATNIAFDGANARLSGNVETGLDLAKLEADYRLAFPRLSVFAKPLALDLAGAAIVTGRAQGATDNPNLRGDLNLSKARVEGFAVPEAAVQFSAADLANAPRGTLNLTATTDYGPVKGSTNYLFAQPDMQLTQLKAESGTANVSGALTIPSDGRPLEGTLQVASQDLAPQLALAGLQGAGAAKAEVRLSGVDGKQAAKIVADLIGPTLTPDGGQPIRAKSLRLDADLRDLLGTPGIRAKVDAAQVALDEVKLATLGLDAEGTARDLNLRLKARGDWRGDLALETAGRLQQGDDSLSLEIASLNGTLLSRDIALKAPFTFAQNGAALDLSPLDLRFGDATVTAQGKLNDERVSAALDIDALPLASLDPVLPSGGIDGMIFAKLKLDGPRANPAGTGTFEVRDIETAAIAEAPKVALNLAGDWRDGRLGVSGTVSGLPGRDARIEAALPLALDPTGLTPSLDPAAPVSGKMDWQGDLAAIWPLLPIDGHRAAGTADVKMTLGGSLAEPALRGTVSLNDAEYENLETGTLLRNLSAKLTFDEREAKIANLSASDGGKGRLNAEGKVALDPARGYPMVASARLTEFLAARRDEIRATTNGKVSLRGNLDDVVFKGNFETRLVEIRIPDTLPPEVASLNVVEVDSSGKGTVFEESDKAGASETKITLDIVIDMPRRVFVRGRGLDSEWAGDLRVTGDAAEPRIVGEVRLVRGQLSLLTKSFRLTEGTIQFPPSLDAPPQLDITASHKSGDVTAIAKISGPATNPTLALSSTPELPQDEIVSRVLFGKDRGQLSPIEAAQLAAAVAELAGKGGPGMLDFARNLMGVDVLRVQGPADGGAGGPSVEAGKYATEGVYVGVKKGVTDQSGAVAVEIEVTPNISVESETGVTGESDIGVKFKWNY
jgi:translocation and assembly module TamB